MNKISILGCGWLGLPLAEYLTLKGYAINGSTTQESKLQILNSLGINSFKINLNPTPETNNLEAFFDTDILVLNLPPRSRQTGISPEFYPKQINSLIPFIKKSTIREVIFISSTSVYPKLNREVVETDADRNSHPAIFDAEQLLLKAEGFRTTILRCAGLAGGKRIPGKFFAGKKDLKNGEEPVNQVFRDDVIQVISQIIRMNGVGGIYNLCAPIHPLKKDLYVKNAELLGLEPPQFTFTEQKQNFKIINSDKLQNRLHFSFMYDNPAEFEYDFK